MFQDEACFGRIIDPFSCWASPRMGPVAARQIIREYTYGAIGTFDSLILPFTNADMVNIFLEEIAKRHLDTYIRIVIDGSSCHILRELIVLDNIELLKIVSYSPGLNPQENVGDEREMVR